MHAWITRVGCKLFTIAPSRTGSVVHQPGLVQRVAAFIKALVSIVVLFFTTIFDPSAADSLKKRGA